MLISYFREVLYLLTQSLLAKGKGEVPYILFFAIAFTVQLKFFQVQLNFFTNSAVAKLQKSPTCSNCSRKDPPW